MISINTTLYNFMKNYHKKGDTTAVVFNNYSMSFPKFFKEIDKVAASFYKCGVRKGDVVMVSLPNIPQCVVAIYALSRIGAIASMVHPKVSTEEFEKLYNEQRPKVVLLSNINHLKFGPKCSDSKVVLCSYLTYDFLGLPIARKFEEFNGDGSEPVFYIQSGGTSGEPKTVVLSSKSCNAAAYNLLNYLDDRFSEDTVMLTALPMFHCLGLGAGMHAPLCANMGIVLLARFDAERVTKAIEKNGVTCMLAVPRMINKLLKYPDFVSERTATLKDMFVGGDTISAKLKHSFNLAMILKNLPARMYPGYGLTESSIVFLSKDDAPDTSCGKPLLNVRYKLVDENLIDVKDGEKGELLLLSDQSMDGYFNDNEATINAFAYIDGDKYVKTGDFFKRDAQGYLYYEGRLKRLIKISGMNVFPNEIERVAKEMLFIDECLAIEIVKDGKNFIRLLVEGNLSEDQKQMTIDYIAEKLSHWSTPKDIVCVDKFYRTGIGKIDIERLQNEYQKD